jgi:hypothetical protein
MIFRTKKEFEGRSGIQAYENAASLDFGSVFNFLYNLKYLNDNREARFLNDQ